MDTFDGVSREGSLAKLVVEDNAESLRVRPVFLAGARSRHLPASTPLGLSQPLWRVMVLSFLTPPHFL